MCHCKERKRRSNLITLGTITSLFLIILFSNNAFATLGNSVNENKRLFGNELVTKQYSDEKKDFTGKIKYQFPYFGWQLETLYIDGKVISEAVRPQGSKVIKKMITERDANVIADVLYPKKERGSYRKQVVNANFISHFFENGVISYEMQLDSRRKNHVGVIGVRAVLYSNGDKFKDIMINAYH